MSGTSLDGLDLALCDFSIHNNTVSFTLLASKTIGYEPIWKERLQNVFEASAEQYFELQSASREVIPTVADALLHAGARLIELRETRRDLEAVFLDLTAPKAT